MRRLFIDLDLGKIVAAAGTTQILTSIDEKRSPNAGLEVQFLRNVTVQELSSGATGKFEIKESGKYDANTLTGAASWVKTGTGTDTVYTFTFDLMVAALNTLLGVEAPVVVTGVAATNVFTSAASPAVDSKIQFQTTGTLFAGILPNTDYWVISSGHTATDFKVSLTQGGTEVDFTTAGSGGSDNKWAKISNDVASVDLMAAIEWVADGRTNETQTFTFTLVNDVVRDTDTFTPPAAEDVVINVRVGKTSLSAGIDYLDVTFASAFAGGATVGVNASVMSPSGGEHIGAWVRNDLTDENGTRIEFSATIPATGYKLAYMAFQV